MSHVALSDIPGISKRTKACFRRAQLFGAHEVLLTPPHELAQTLRLSRPDVEVLLRQVAKAAAPPVLSTLDILHGNVQIEQTAPEELEEDSASSSDSEASVSFVPPTQGYEGNFPGLRGAPSYLSDSDDAESSDASESPLHHTNPSPLLPSNAFTTDISAGDPLVDGREGYIRTSGSYALDELLNGGFRTAALSEIVGESASGKTQLAIQVCVFAALAFVPLAPETAPDATEIDLATVERDTLHGILGDEGVLGSQVGSSYITSGGERGAHAVVRRAVQFAHSAVRERFQRRYAALLADDAQQDELETLEQTAIQLAERQVLDNLHVACVADVEALQHALHYSLPGLMTRLANTHLPIGVVVVDSLPTMFQQEPATSDLDSLFLRSQALIEIADALKRLSLPYSHRALLPAQYEQRGRAVLVLNHVSDAFGADKDVARQFVFETAAAPRTARVIPDYPASMGYTAQSAFCSGLLASVPPSLAETIAASAPDAPTDSPLYVLNPKTAQLGHTWTNCINMRLFLAQTRGRVAAEDDARRRLTVRRAAVVFSAFGPSMLDPLSDAGARKWRKEDRQLRFVITPSNAVHALAAYTVRNPALTTIPAPPADADQEYFTNLDDRDLLEVDLDPTTMDTM